MGSRLFVVALMCLAASGCMTLPVKGTSETGDETFSGTATGGIDGAGKLQITTSKGVRCEGDFVYATERQGRGTFVCENGQSGGFEFVSTGNRGTGTGSIGGRRFTFTFG